MWRYCVYSIMCLSVLACASNVNAGELSIRDEWWNSTVCQTAVVFDVEVNPVADVNGFHRPAVAWADFNGTNAELRVFFSVFDNTQWITTQVANISTTGILFRYLNDIAIAFRPSGGGVGIAITWSRTVVVGGQQQMGSKCQLIERVSGSWNAPVTIKDLGTAAAACNAVIESRGIFNVDMAYTPAGVPCIIYSGSRRAIIGNDCGNTSFVEYSENRATGQEVESFTGINVPTYFGLGASISMNPVQGQDLLKPAIVYGTTSSTSTWTFRQKVAAGNSWTAPQTVIGQAPDLAFLSDGTPVVAHSSGTGSAYRERISGTWTSAEAIDSSNNKPKIKVDPLTDDASVIIGKGIVYTRRGSNSSWIYNGEVPNTLITTTSSNTPNLAVDPSSGQVYAVVRDNDYSHGVVLGTMMRLTVRVESSNPSIAIWHDDIFYALTDSQGNFYYENEFHSLDPLAILRFSNLPSDEYDLWVAVPGHVCAGTTFTLDAASMWREDFILDIGSCF